MSEYATIRFRDALLAAHTRGASDLHLCAEHRPFMRVDGVLEALDQRPVDAPELAALATHLFGRLPETEDSIALDDAQIGRLRVHAFHASGSMALAVRLLATAVPTLESLELPPIVERLCTRTRGLVLFAGATGSGKSTTQAALIDRINRTSHRRVITIENPIEYRHHSLASLVSQREIGRDAPSIAAALVGALRADPDVIAVGEVRESAEIRSVLTAAETGHLVFATLHTGDAVQSVERILGGFEGPMQAAVRAQLAEALLGVVAQRLVLRRGGRGRRAVVEVLVATDAVRNLIREGRSHQIRNAIATGATHGMQLFEQHMEELVAEGAVSMPFAVAS